MENWPRWAFRVARDFSLVGLDSAFRAFHPGRRTSEGDVAIVRMDGIGDFVVWLDAFAALRQHYEGRRITLICNAAWYDLARCVPGFDEIIPIEVGRLRVDLRYRYRTLGALLRRRFATVINPLYSRQGFADAEAVVRMLRTDERVGSSGDPSVGWRSRLGSWWFDRLIPASAPPLMELVRNAEFLRGLGLTGFRAGLPELSPEWFPDPGLDLEEYYVLFAGALDPIRQWPARSFAEIGRRVFERTGMTGVVCGGPGEVAIASEIASLSGVPVRNLAGRTTLPELVAVIARARLVVTNETGAVHIAAALSVPAVCILGGGHFGRFLPYICELETDRPRPRAVFEPMGCYHCNWRCVHPLEPGAAAPCVEQISADAVFRQIEALLPQYLILADPDPVTS